MRICTPKKTQINTWKAHNRGKTYKNTGAEYRIKKIDGSFYIEMKSRFNDWEVQDEIYRSIIMGKYGN